MNPKQEAFQSLPAVDKLLALAKVKLLISHHGKTVVTFAIRNALQSYRTQMEKGVPLPAEEQVVEQAEQIIKLLESKSLKSVYNATGVIIHTNLGRAPFGSDLLNDSMEVLKSYNNLEFNLEEGKRGSRNEHASRLIKFLTGAEDVLVVNNNAAAVMLILRTFARRKEVVISRGELIEIGGSFRIPEIMKTSDCKMVEVGTTNRTNPDDYRKAINPKTALLFKAHKSNYVIKGFSQEVGLDILAQIGRETGIPVVFDLGSGLLRAIDIPFIDTEPTASDALTKGADLVCFSGDKLMGGPQAGIIVGKKNMIAKLKKEPMLRALRVCKTTLALLETACSYYLNDRVLKEKNVIFKLLNRTPDENRGMAESLSIMLQNNGIDANVIPSEGQFGGGTLPDGVLNSFAVQIQHQGSNRVRSAYAEKMYHALLMHHTPVVGVLKQGAILFDVLTLFADELEPVAKAIADVHGKVND
ncbi:MAG TPA: L-seryl-tRNA(Sec) selenium transferase [Tenuifilaceae bacterium]|jgi:L-seryl-tRNA(Ser) seleniumtransferase|nr:L-seryl-tRNA(Sec) selenium transferase [Bacteroidales bacterium]MDI9517279.1 L-seryl-tRNA(Sec) selenium transferase [Bacteroidota bacterium]OQC62784.1 MAG: L-seryl-tRNA(Sec) selenium transferase [Bacteroidetes bacterium ADurb.Bin008]HNV81887.1 L-seryl-tRNA(Sec) selenium transferase [Tenuifilaceae bacterium]MZP83030.1 L-seryl-tRNA(Sec) selenium transferase [Bacteroidales bacterium]